ncbi:Holliday junction branch migration protein RuvA [Patescibacteria group bacterium]|nr:Holliday junction branch migration protein RuvA [Patescibacteria group bacterium]MCG2701959.1 Holliday junction branch migration protein RuvA [Candidatus Parcubacteria bacterium]MBU4265039.1 Holliday junction branch migration protein RuvA [Patescibacteria group bacterium]MBU4390192.1 Holliday junction branch migration protein RuvA [Patescibacteria group bacterium]MBU4397444.1 Holliday junction branch migration protein RuvA [Patescibacteria group bacterium]
MISSLRGVLLRKGIRLGEVDVGGVGYLVNLGSGLLNNWRVGQEVEVFTYMAVSENDMSLYGFGDIRDVEMFKILISVSGVGPKSAMQIFDNSLCEDIREAIVDANVDFFQKIKGIGKKTAQRIIVDLKSKIGSEKELDLTSAGFELEKDELYLGLVQLGFDKNEIRGVVSKVPVDVEMLEQKIEWCLRNIN